MAFSLFGNRQKKIPESKQVQEIELDKIMPNRYQPRHTFSDESIEELATTLKEQGLLQPIILRKPADGPEGEYEIIAGERRFRAAQSLKWAKIPAIVENMDDEKAASLALVENLQRENLKPLDEAMAYRTLMDSLKLKQEEVANRVGKSRSYVANFLRLLTLPQPVQELVQSGELTSGHARTLLGLKDQTKIVPVAKKAVKEGLTVRALEQLVQSINEPAKKVVKKVAKPKKSMYIIESEERLMDKFGTSVQIVEKGERGKIEIEYLSQKDLTRILEVLEIELDD